MRLTVWLLILGGVVAFPLGAQTLVQVTSNASGYYDQYPAISEDGQIFAWCGKDPVAGRNQVWVADLRTLKPRMLTSGAGIPIPYPIGLSGDGTTIVYMESNNLWTVPVAGGTPKQITTYTGNKRVRTYGITMSRDGSLACYTTYDSGTTLYDVEVVNTVTTSIVNITKHTSNDFCTGGISGDGKTVAFTANRGNAGDQVWLANADGTNIRKLTSFASGNAFYPKLDFWARICAFESSQSSQYEIYTIFTDGTGLTDVSQNPSNQDRRPWISTDGDRVTWKSTRGSGSDIYMAYPDGTGLRQLTQFGNMSPSLTNASHALNGDGTFALFASPFNYKGGNPEGDYEIYLWKDALTRTGRAAPASTVVFNLEDASRPNAAYAVRCSMGRSPGIPIPGVGTVPLTIDALFWLSGLLPSMFQNFDGNLNAQGLGAASVVIPKAPALIGFGFYTSFVTAQPGAKIYNPVLVVIQ